MGPWWILVHERRLMPGTCGVWLVALNAMPCRTRLVPGYPVIWRLDLGLAIRVGTLMISRARCSDIRVATAIAVGRVSVTSIVRAGFVLLALGLQLLVKVDTFRDSLVLQLLESRHFEDFAAATSRVQTRHRE